MANSKFFWSRYGNFLKKSQKSLCWIHRPFFWVASLQKLPKKRTLIDA
jgi:hypothetical protein